MALIHNTSYKTKGDDITDAELNSCNIENGAMVRTSTGLYMGHGSGKVKVYPHVGSGQDVTNNNFTIEGGGTYNVQTISNDITLDGEDHVIFINKSSGGDLNITLPLASSYEGKVYIIRTRKNSEDAVVTRSGSDKIDDGAIENSITIAEAKSRMLISDGISTWYAVDNIGQ